MFAIQTFQKSQSKNLLSSFPQRNRVKAHWPMREWVWVLTLFHSGSFTVRLSEASLSWCTSCAPAQAAGGSQPLPPAQPLLALACHRAFPCLLQGETPAASAGRRKEALHQLPPYRCSGSKDNRKKHALHHHPLSRLCRLFGNNHRCSGSDHRKGEGGKPMPHKSLRAC